MNAGFSLKAQPAVNIPAASVFNSTFPAPDKYRVGEAVLSPLGRDRRYLYSNLPIQNVDGETAVQDFKQTVRTLTGTAVRDIAATTDKASLDVTITHVLEALKQVAVTINDVPNQLLESVGAMRAFLDQEGRFQVEKAIDAHVMAQIVAAASPFGTSGTGLVAALLAAQASKSRKPRGLIRAIKWVSRKIMGGTIDPTSSAWAKVFRKDLPEGFHPHVLVELDNECA